MTARLALFAMCCAVGFQARAGLILTVESKGQRSTLSIEGNRVRFDAPEAAGISATIFDGDARKLLMVNSAERSWMEMTEADLKALAAQLRAATAAAPGQKPGSHAGGGPEASKPRQKYEPMGKKDTVAGLRCEWYRERVGDKVEAEACYIPWGAGTLSRKDFAPFIQMGELMEPLTAAASAEEGRDDLRRLIADAPGFPAVQVTTSEDGSREEERLVKLERTSVPAERFRPPAGYRKAEKPSP